jgi:hypothetical protein
MQTSECSFQSVSVQLEKTDWKRHLHLHLRIILLRIKFKKIVKRSTIEMCRISTAGVDVVLQRHIWKKWKNLQRCVDNQDVRKVFSHCQQQESCQWSWRQIFFFFFFEAFGVIDCWRSEQDWKGVRITKTKKIDFSQKVFSDRCIGIMFWVFFFLFLRRKFAIQQNLLDCLFSELMAKRFNNKSI